MTTAVRRGRPRSETIDAAIMDATVAEIIERGFVAMTMESVAARAGVAKTTLYRRWPDTTELGLEAMRRLKSPPAEPPEGSVRDQLVWLTQRMRRTWNDPTFVAVMRRVAAEGTTHPTVYRDCRDRLVGPHLKVIDDVIERGKAEGLIRADADTDWVRRLMTSPMLASSLTLKKPVGEREQERTVDTVLRGLAP